MISSVVSCFCSGRCVIVSAQHYHTLLSSVGVLVLYGLEPISLKTVDMWFIHVKSWLLSCVREWWRASHPKRKTLQVITACNNQIYHQLSPKLDELSGLKVTMIALLYSWPIKCVCCDWQRRKATDTVFWFILFLVHNSSMAVGGCLPYPVQGKASVENKKKTANKVL